MNQPHANQPEPSGILNTGSTSLAQLHEAGLAFVQGLCTIITQPLEYALRPFFGTRYFSPVCTFFSCILMTLLAAAGQFDSHIPFFSGSARSGLIGLTMLSALFFLGNLLHGPRVYWRMLHPEREKHSKWEGDALPFLSPLFARLPHGIRFWPVRIVYEPLTIFLVAVVGTVAHLFAPLAGFYLAVCAVALSVKCSFEWYRNWSAVRNILDAQAAGSILADAASGKASDKDLNIIHIAGLPKGISNEIKVAAIAQRTGTSLPSHIAQFVSPVQKPEPPKAA